MTTLVTMSRTIHILRPDGTNFTLCGLHRPMWPTVDRYRPTEVECDKCARADTMGRHPAGKAV